MVNIYVLNKDGLPLMPIHSYGRAKKLLKSKRAHVVNKNPFTIRMNEQLNNPVVDDCLLGIDPGRTNIGLCVIDRYGNILFASDVVTRNKELRRLMRDRKLSRQASRRGERKVRQRRAIRTDKTGMARATEFWRIKIGRISGNQQNISSDIQWIVLQILTVFYELQVQIAYILYFHFSRIKIVSNNSKYPSTSIGLTPNDCARTFGFPACNSVMLPIKSRYVS